MKGLDWKALELYNESVCQAPREEQSNDKEQVGPTHEMAGLSERIGYHHKQKIQEIWKSNLRDFLTQIHGI